MKAYDLSMRWLQGAGLCVLFLGTGSWTAHADAQPTVGRSPTSYTTPLTSAQQEMEMFRRFRRMQENGELSLEQYQQMVMRLAILNKEGMNGPSSVTPIDVILPPTLPASPVIPTPSNPLPSNAHTTPVMSNPWIPSTIASHRPDSSRMGQIQRPASGSFSSVVVRDVAAY